MSSEIFIKRIYEKPESGDGFTILVDRLWPRGIRKEDAFWDAWLKEIAPSADLRKWFNHEPEKWPDFKKAYKAELKNSNAMVAFTEYLDSHKIVTLLYAGKDREHSHVLVLLEVAKKIMKK